MRLEFRRRNVVLVLSALIVILALFYVSTSDLKSMKDVEGNISIEEKRDAVAEKKGEAFIEEVFVGQYQPENTDFQKSMIKTGEKEGTDYVYGAVWESSGYRFWTGVYFLHNESAGEDLTKVYRIRYSMRGPETGEGYSFDGDTMRTVSSGFVNLQPKNIECESDTLQEGGRTIRATSCDSYWNSDRHEDGFKMFKSDGTETPELWLLGCRRFPESPSYDSGSCSNS